VGSFLALGIAAVVAMLFQTTVFPSIPGLPVVPDLILVLAVYLGVAHQTIGGAAGTFLLGYFLDTFSGTVLGQNAFALSAVYMSVQFVARHLWFERGLPVVALAFFGGLVHAVASVAAAWLAGTSSPIWHHALRTGLLGTVAAALVAPAVFAALAREKRLLGLT
jgi:rod shape-determining protein MreD